MLVNRLYKTLVGAMLAFLLVATIFTAHRALAQNFTVLHTFTGGADGSHPHAGLTLQGTSNLFGGAGNNTVFRLKKTNGNWVFTPVFQFDGANGLALSGRMVFGPGGALYGATSNGGTTDCGTPGGCGLVFSMRPPSTVCGTVSCPWTQNILYEFSWLNPPTDGTQPNGGMVFDSVGNIYGTTVGGGLNGAGTVFELSNSQGSWFETVLYDFPGEFAVSSPNGNVVIDQAGNIIGTAQFGGPPGCSPFHCGSIFELTQSSQGWVASTLHEFNGDTDGGVPMGGLIADAAGNLYGTTTTAGPAGGGTVFELTPSNGGYSFQVIHSFTGLQYQVGPRGLLAMDSSGNLYGVTLSEGAFSAGNVFKLTHSGGTWTYTDLYDFTNGNDGGTPFDGPTLGPDGTLYGTTYYGGGDNCQNGCGVVWQLTQ